MGDPLRRAPPAGAGCVAVGFVITVQVVVGATVVAGAAVSELEPQDDATNRSVRTTGDFPIALVWHPSPEGE